VRRSCRFKPVEVDVGVFLPGLVLLPDLLSSLMLARIARRNPSSP